RIDYQLPRHPSPPLFPYTTLFRSRWSSSPPAPSAALSTPPRTVKFHLISTAKPRRSRSFFWVVGCGALSVMARARNQTNLRGLRSEERRVGKGVEMEVVGGCR